MMRIILPLNPYFLFLSPPFDYLTNLLTTTRLTFVKIPKLPWHEQRAALVLDARLGSPTLV